MDICLISSDKKRFLPLLLLADEQESMIDRYLDKGDLFAMTDGGNTVAVAVVVTHSSGVVELKNLAVDPSCRQRGIGRRMIGFIADRYPDSTLFAGTGDSPATLPFYRKCGFSYSHTLPDFFTANYDHPIIDGGVLLKDMVYLKKSAMPEAERINPDRSPALIAALLKIWKESVKASHLFLTETDISALVPYVEDTISRIETLIVAYRDGNPVAFTGIEARKIEMLFASPPSHGQGFGKRLVGLATGLFHADSVDVNEQNPKAKGFYEHLGFQVFRRNGLDGQGNPFPILEMTLSPVRFRTATTSDAANLAKLFRNTVLSVNRKDYTAEETEDWAACGNDLSRWRKFTETHHFIIAEVFGKIVGFSSITPTGYLDHLFVDKDHQRQRIASMLLYRIETYARTAGIRLIETEASITAKPFFEHHGYTTVARQTRRAKNLQLTNFRMEKLLP